MHNKIEAIIGLVGGPLFILIAALAFMTDVEPARIAAHCSFLCLFYLWTDYSKKWKKERDESKTDKA